MNYSEFLNTAIEKGIKAAAKDYTEPNQKDKLEGSVAGLNACRDLAPVRLIEILKMAKEQTHEAYIKEVDTLPKQADEKRYWYYRCYELEVEWICNVVSAMLMNEGMDVIIPPTAHGVLMADSILKSSI